MDATKIIQILCDNGFKAYLTGGAVRDLFIGKTPNDEDVTTNATPEEIENLFPDSKINSVGKQFLVTIVDNIEVATYRSDKNCNVIGKDHAKVFKCETIEEDLARRDFTINAMAFCPYTGDTIDLYGGKEDLSTGTIKFVGNPKDRILEDPCRILRACRMAAIISGHIEIESLIAMKKEAHLVRIVVKPERIRLEILKAMKSEYPGIFFGYLKEIGLLEFIFPSLFKTISYGGGQYHGETVYAHSIIVGNSMKASKKTGDQQSLIRLAGFLHDVGKPQAWIENNEEDFHFHEIIGSNCIKEELKNLRFSISEIEYITNLIRLHMYSFTDNISDKSIRKFIIKLKDHNITYQDWMRLRIADRIGNLKKTKYSIQKIRNYFNKVENILTEKEFVSKLSLLKVNGNDVMKITKRKPCKEIGIILNQLLDLVIDNPELNNEEFLSEKIHEIDVELYYENILN